VLLNTAIHSFARRVRRRASRAAAPLVDERPGCAFGLATRRGLDDLAKDFERLEAKVNGLLFGVAATLLAELWRAWR